MEEFLPFISAKLLVYLGFGLLYVFYWVFAFFILYHLIRFGVGTRPKQLALVFLVGSIILFFLSIIASSYVGVPPILREMYMMSSPQP